MKAEELYGDGGYRCEPIYSLLLMDGSLTLLVQFQTLEVGTTSPLRDTRSRLLLPTTAPLAVEGDEANHPTMALLHSVNACEQCIYYPHVFRIG